MAANGNGSSNSWMWPTVGAAFLALLQVFWGVVYSSVSADGTRRDGELKEIRTHVSNMFLSIREHEEYARSVRRDIESLTHRQEKIADEQSRRSQILAKVENLEKRVDIQFGRVEQVASSLGQVVTPAKAIEDLKKDIEGLRSTLWNSRVRNSPFESNTSRPQP
jgi:uncharacterized coiled-coil DUF342 family protein